MDSEVEKFANAMSNLIAQHPDLDGREVQTAMRTVLCAYYADYEPVFSAEDILRLIGEGVTRGLANDAIRRFVRPQDEGV